jgi:hypothetical protein
MRRAGRRSSPLHLPNSGLAPLTVCAYRHDVDLFLKWFAAIAGEVFVDAGAVPFDFDKKNELNYFVRAVTPQGEQRIYWGKDFPRALEEAGAKVGDSITATWVASKPVTVEEIQEQNMWRPLNLA